MKKSLLVALLAVAGLSGCVAVPVYDPGPSPAPAYGHYYAPPAATFSFGYYHHGGHRHHHRRHHRHW